ncbi:SAP domain-containing protein, partial [Meloidogyne graminicola]
YIPSDFIRCNFDWTTSIPLGIPIKFSSHPINFHVLHKDIDAPMDGESSVENPSDADYRFLVKVMLISHPGLMSIRRKLSGLMADGSIDESTETQPLTKTIQLLVGHRGKGEYMCIGGPWSPSLDGKNPLDPVTLVKTAIRTAKAMTGLNLAECSKWYVLCFFNVKMS